MDEIRARIPELPDRRRDRYVADYALSAYDAALLTASKATADYFEACLAVKLPQEDLSRRAKAISNWLTGEMARLLNQSGSDIADARVTPQALSELIDLVEDGTITSTQARTLFEELFPSGGSPRKVVDQRGLAQVKDPDSLLPAVREAIEDNPQAVADYLGGKETAMRFLVGQVMKISQGSANPKLAQKLMKEKLESMR